MSPTILAIIPTWYLGRVSFNPLKHIDPFGTLLLPAILLFSHSPFLFGYAKPVPVNFRALRHPRDRHGVGGAGRPRHQHRARSLIAGCGISSVALLQPDNSAQWIADNLKNALVINVVLAVFNMLQFRLWTAEGSRSGCCRTCWRCPLSRLEPFGMLILIGFLILLPLVGAQLGLNLDVISTILRTVDPLCDSATSLVTGNA